MVAVQFFGFAIKAAIAAGSAPGMQSEVFATAIETVLCSGSRCRSQLTCFSGCIACSFFANARCSTPMQLLCMLRHRLHRAIVL